MDLTLGKATFRTHDQKDSASPACGFQWLSILMKKKGMFVLPDGEEQVVEFHRSDDLGHFRPMALFRRSLYDLPPPLDLLSLVILGYLDDGPLRYKRDKPRSAYFGAVLQYSLKTVPLAWGLRDGDMDYGFGRQLIIFKYSCGEGLVPDAFNASPPSGTGVVEKNDILAYSNSQHMRQMVEIGAINCDDGLV
jgi:hypothetical protein